GRTNKVAGSMTINGTTVSAVDLTVDMTSVSSDEGRRDRQFQGRIMSTSTYPTATFTLTQPVQLSTIPQDSTVVQARATGDLTMRGVTRSVTFDLKARRNGANIEINGTIPITFSNWNIPNPSFAGISTEDHGVLEFLV